MSFENFKKLDLYNLNLVFFLQIVGYCSAGSFMLFESFRSFGSFISFRCFRSFEFFCLFDLIRKTSKTSKKSNTLRAYSKIVPDSLETHAKLKKT